MSAPDAPLEPAGCTVDGRGVARSARFDDVYQPDVDGGQARAVFVAGTDLARRCADGGVTVLELGFGTGTNFLEAWRAWRAAGARHALRYLGLDGHPLSREEALRVAGARAAARGEALPWDVAALAAAWPPTVRGEHRLALADALAAAGGGAERAPELTLVHDDFEAALGRLAAARPASVDAFFLDGFAPAKNPSAWTPAVFGALGALARPGAAAATWSVASVVRLGLAAAGFEVARRPGHGRKRERLVASKRP